MAASTRNDTVLLASLRGSSSRSTFTRRAINCSPPLRWMWRVTLRSHGRAVAAMAMDTGFTRSGTTLSEPSREPSSGSIHTRPALKAFLHWRWMRRGTSSSHGRALVRMAIAMAFSPSDTSRRLARLEAGPILGRAPQAGIPLTPPGRSPKRKPPGEVPGGGSRVPSTLLIVDQLRLMARISTLLLAGSVIPVTTLALLSVKL